MTGAAAAAHRWVPPGSVLLASENFEDSVLSSEAMADSGASGARLTRLTVSDGTKLVSKEISADWDWMMPATADSGRAAELWVTGAMARLPATIDPAIVGIDRTERGWRIYMRDVGDHFLRRGTRVSRAEARRLLASLAEMHAAYWNDVPVQAATIESLLTLAAPATLERLVPAGNGFRTAVQRGWQVFTDLCPPDVRDAVVAVLRDPVQLASGLRAAGTTLTHSDPHYGNIAPLPDRFVVLDWSLAAQAPPALDFAWYLDQSAALIDATPEELADDFAELEADRHDERTLRLAYLAELVLAGWQCAAIVDTDDDARRSRLQGHFEWWVTAARRGLEVL